MHVMEQGDLEELSQLELAKQVGEALNKHYPDHGIYVFDGGVRRFDSTDTGTTGIYRK